MHFPTLRDNLYVLFNDGFNDGYLLFLETVIIYLFYGVHIIFGFLVVLNDVNMYRIMVI